MRSALVLAALPLLSCSHARQGTDTVFRSLDEGPVRISALRGRVVLLDFWATWCEPCTVSLPFYARLLREAGAQGLSAVAVSTDESDDEVRKYLARAPLPFARARDPNGSIADALGVVLIPTTFLLDRQGRVRFKHQGFSAADEGTLRSEVAALLAEPQ